MDLKELKTLFFQQRYQDLPESIKPTGANIVPYAMQLVLLEKGNKKWDIIKHIRFADGARVLRSSITGMAMGRPLEIDYQKNFTEGSKACPQNILPPSRLSLRFLGLIEKLWPDGTRPPVRKTNSARSAPIGTTASLSPLWPIASLTRSPSTSSARSSGPHSTETLMKRTWLQS